MLPSTAKTTITSKNGTCASVFGLTATNSSMNGTKTRHTPTDLATTKFQTSPNKNLPNSAALTLKSQPTPMLPPLFPANYRSLYLLTGLMPVKLVQLKIKASAVHAGPSLLLLLLSPPSLLIMAPHPVTIPNSNLFPAHLPTET